MENRLSPKTFLYKATYAFMLVPFFTLHPMELQEPAKQLVAVDLEAQRHNATALTVELVKHIQEGNIAHIHELLIQQTEDKNDFVIDAAKRNQLIRALEYAKEELELQQEQRAKKKCDNCFARYKKAILPTVLIAYSAANITLSVLSYCQLQHPPSTVDIASLSLNIIGSVFPGIAYAGYETIKHLKSGWHDTHQKNRIAQLRNSQVVLHLLRETQPK